MWSKILCLFVYKCHNSTFHQLCLVYCYFRSRYSFFPERHQQQICCTCINRVDFRSRYSYCSLKFISHGTIFFSHNKTVPINLSAAETIQRTWWLPRVYLNVLFYVYRYLNLDKFELEQNASNRVVVPKCCYSERPRKQSTVRRAGRGAEPRRKRCFLGERNILKPGYKPFT
jgi:hypothetical protein